MRGEAESCADDATPPAGHAPQRSEYMEVQGALITGAGPVKSQGPSAEAYGSPEARTFFANAEEGLAAMDRVRLHLASACCTGGHVVAVMSGHSRPAAVWSSLHMDWCDPSMLA